MPSEVHVFKAVRWLTTMGFKEKFLLSLCLSHLGVSNGVGETVTRPTVLYVFSPKETLNVGNRFQADACMTQRSLLLEDGEIYHEHGHKPGWDCKGNHGHLDSKVDSWGFVGKAHSLTQATPESLREPACLG